MPKPKDINANEEKTKEEPTKRFVMEEIPTQTTQVIRDTKNDEIYDLFTVMIRILENQEDIMKKVEEVLAIANQID